MSDVSYRNLLYKIGQQLSKHDHQQLLHMCGLANQADNIPDAQSLLQRLQDEPDSQLEIDQLGTLEEVLVNLNERSLLGELKAFEKKRKEYTNLLAKVSDALVSDERIQLEQLKTICHEEETSLELDESISGIRALFKELGRRKKLGFRRLDFLKTILRRIEREDLVGEIEEYGERRNENDVAERREANPWCRPRTEGETVCVKTVIRVGERFLTFHDIMSTFQSVGRLFGSFTNWFQSQSTDIELIDFSDERVPFSDESVPFSDESVPFSDESVPFSDESVPSSDESVPSSDESVPFSDESVYFTVQAKRLKGLTTLWEMFKNGTLEKSLYDFLVTYEVIKLAEAGEDVELTVSIEEEEYKRACIDLNNDLNKAKGHPMALKRKRTYSGLGISTTPNKDETLEKEVKRKMIMSRSIGQSHSIRYTTKQVM